MSELKIITAPSIFVVGRQVVDEGELARFLDAEGAAGWTTDAPSAAEKLCELGGRVCYASWKNPRPGGSSAYLSHIVEARHGRIAEHAVWTFLLTGISRSLSHELYTHTVGMSKSMLSQRYVDSSDVAFVVPPALVCMDNVKEINFSFAYSEWYGACKSAATSYRALAIRLDLLSVDVSDRTVRRKAAREAARSVLPNCVETKICVTANARALRNFFEQRGSAGADAEIRRLAIAWLAVMKREAVNLFGDYVTADDGTISTPNRKV